MKDKNFKQIALISIVSGLLFFIAFNWGDEKQKIPIDFKPYQKSIDSLNNLLYEEKDNFFHYKYRYETSKNIQYQDSMKLNFLIRKKILNQIELLQNKYWNEKQRH